MFVAPGRISLETLFCRSCAVCLWVGFSSHHSSWSDSPLLLFRLVVSEVQGLTMCMHAFVCLRVMERKVIERGSRERERGCHPLSLALSVWAAFKTCQLSLNGGGGVDLEGRGGQNKEYYPPDTLRIV